MALPPEVVFDRYFREVERRPEERGHYWGKQDLAKLRPQVAAFLIDVQSALNEALKNEKKNVPEHVDHPPFHFDYIASDIANALAFQCGEYSFIGITMPLFSKLWESCVALSKSKGVSALLEIAETPEGEEAILTVMCQTQLTFIVSHEYTHHVHGQLRVSNGGLEAQAFEMDADGYAVYHVLAHLINGPRREQAVQLLGCAHSPSCIQDEKLFSSFVFALGALRLSRSLSPVDLSNVYLLSHPVPVARMNCVMRHAINWCRQNDRPVLAAYMTPNQFQVIMATVEHAISGTTVTHNWREQAAFLKSEEGSKYLKRLDALVKAHVEAL
jgi:hypothetical protein